ncbi:MAG: hypothetical protein ACI8P7_000561 [Candidatus Azotimanducaceae bacterium]|jgi:hypothetical protein
MVTKNISQTDLDQLMLAKDFESLAPSEKALVLAEISIAEYELQRSLLLQFYKAQQHEKKTQASPLVKQQLLSALQEDKQAAKPLVIPWYWSAVAAVVLFFFGTFFGGMFNVVDEIEAPIQVVYQSDTVYVPEYVEVEKERVVYKTKYITEKKATVTNSATIAEINPEPQYGLLAYNNPIVPKKGRTGKSIAEDSLKFLFSANLEVY